MGTRVARYLHCVMLCPSIILHHRLTCLALLHAADGSRDMASGESDSDTDGKSSSSSKSAKSGSDSSTSSHSSDSTTQSTSSESSSNSDSIDLSDESVAEVPSPPKQLVVAKIPSAEPQSVPVPTHEQQIWQTAAEHEHACMGRTAQVDGKAAGEAVTSKFPSQADPVSQAVESEAGSEEADGGTEPVPHLATCRWMVGEYALQAPGASNGSQQDAPGLALPAVAVHGVAEEQCGTGGIDSSHREALLREEDLPLIAEHMSSAAAGGVSSEVQEQPCAEDLVPPDAAKTESAEVLAFIEECLRACETKQVAGQSSQQPQRASQREKPRALVVQQQCKPRIRAAAAEESKGCHMAGQQGYLFMQHEPFESLEEGVQWVLGELVKTKLLYPNSLTETCMTALAALSKPEQQEQVRLQGCLSDA